MRDLPRRILSWSNYSASDKLGARLSLVAILFSNSWIRIPVLGLVYFVIGYGSTLLVHPSIQFWRLAAWVASAATFAAHFAYEHFRIRNSPLTTAINNGAAVAIGGFLLAVAATIHASTVNEHAPYSLFVIALIAWPLITGVPAFLVSLVIAGSLRWLKIPGGAAT